MNHTGVSLPTVVALGSTDASDSPTRNGGNGFHTRFADDLAMLAQNGVRSLRLGFDWSRLQPRSGMGHDLDGSWVEWYSDVCTAAHEVGIGVWPILLERSLPRWFDDERGFADPKTADRHWPRFIEAVAETFGHRVAGWFPIDDPIGFAARRGPHDPARHGEFVDTMVVAWRDAWRVLRGGPPVSGAFGIRTVRPVDGTVPAAESARREDHLRWKTFLRGLRDGTIVIPGRADRTLPDLAGAIDLIGIKIRTDLADDVSVDDDTLRRWEERSTSMLHRVAEEGPDLPIVVAAYRVSRSAASETASDAEVFTEAFGRAISSARRDGVSIHSIFYEPAIAATKDTQEAAFFDWDRHLTPAGAAWVAVD